MRSRRLTRGLSAVAGGLAIVAMIGITAACSKEESKAPETSTTTSSTTSTTQPPLSPTENRRR